MDMTKTKYFLIKRQALEGLRIYIYAYFGKNYLWRLDAWDVP
jgi:hypothetical protein